jgi:ubiquitin thioesterase ZRANB1
MQTQEDTVTGKWRCEYCTYDNWPSSNKCVMCRAPASTVQGQDIFNLDRMDRRRVPKSSAVSAPTDRDRDNILNVESDQATTQALKHQEPECTKWSCTACTYYNYARSIRCTQCSTPRKKVSPSSLSHSRLSPGSLRGSPTPTSPATSILHPPSLQQAHTAAAATSISTVNRENAIRSLADQFQPLRICDAAPLEAETSSVSRSSGGQASHSAPPRLHQQNTCSNSAKWACMACTYENWQRSKSCVLCGVQRGRKSPEPPSTSPLHASSLTRDSHSPEGASNRRIEMGGSGDRRAGSGGGSADRRASPECASAGPGPVSMPDQSGSSSPAVGGAIAGSNCNIQYEKRLRQLR